MCKGPEAGMNELRVCEEQKSGQCGWSIKSGRRALEDSRVQSGGAMGTGLWFGFYLKYDRKPSEGFKELANMIVY